MIAKFNYPQVWMMILAWFVADLATPLIIRLCHRLGALDRPGGYKAHAEPVAMLGGVAVYLAFAVALFSILRFTSFEANRDVFAILLGGFVILIVGCIDDFKPIWAVAKLGLLFVVTLLLFRFGVRIILTGEPALDLALTVLWIVGASSAMNSLDNMDGAAAGVGAIAAFWTFYIAWYSEPMGQERVSYVAIAVLGACLVFGVNRHV